MNYYQIMYKSIDKIAVGERIKLLRRNLGLTQSAVGKKIGVTKGAISQWESGLNKSYDAEYMIALADLFNTTIHELLYGKNLKLSSTTEDPIKLEEYASVEDIDYIVTIINEALGYDVFKSNPPDLRQRFIKLILTARRKSTSQEQTIDLLKSIA